MTIHGLELSGVSLVAGQMPEAARGGISRD